MQLADTGSDHLPVGAHSEEGWQQWLGQRGSADKHQNGERQTDGRKRGQKDGVKTAVPSRDEKSRRKGANTEGSCAVLFSESLEKEGGDATTGLNHRSVCSGPTEQRNIDRLPVQKGYHALKCHNSLFFFPTMPPLKTEQRNGNILPHKGSSYLSQDIVSHTNLVCTLAPTLTGWLSCRRGKQVDELQPLVTLSIWVVDRLKKTSCLKWAS